MTEATCEGEGVINVVEFTIIYKKEKYEQKLSGALTIGDVKLLIEPLINVPVAMQKFILKGILNDDSRLTDVIVGRGTKIMVVGSRRSEAHTVIKDDIDAGSIDEVRDVTLTLAETSEHQQVLERHGKPDDIMVGIINQTEPLPSDLCVTGMYDRRGQKIRIRINLDRSELILATRDRTQKVPLATIEDFVHSPFPNHPGYELVAFQLGPTEKSRFYVYWFPSQYVEAMNEIIMQYKLFDDK